MIHLRLIQDLNFRKFSLSIQYLLICLFILNFVFEFATLLEMRKINS